MISIHPFSDMLLTTLFASAMASAQPLQARDSHTHITITSNTDSPNLAITSAKHVDSGPLQVPSARLTPFKVSNFVISNGTADKSIHVTLTTAVGETGCSITIGADKKVTGDDYYPCGKGSFLAYPKEGHVAVMGYVESAGTLVTGNGHGDIELEVSGDGTGLSQIGEADVPIAVVRTWVDPTELPTA